jgi:hypothetical protein
MSRGAHHFRQSDLCKALKAATQAGLSVARFEIDKDGRIVVIAGKAGQDAVPEPNEWDSIE